MFHKVTALNFKNITMTLSEEIGINRMVTNRILKELENDECIIMERGKIFLTALALSKR